MSCLFPKLIKNPRYLPNKKNGGKPPALTDKRVEFVPVSCGKCIECRKKRRRECAVMSVKMQGYTPCPPDGLQQKIEAELGRPVRIVCHLALLNYYLG